MPPSDRSYQSSHEWAKLEDGLVTVGITDIAVERLSDLVFVDLPANGKTITQGEVFGEVESVKAVSELLSPVSGTVRAVNESVADQLDLLAKDPFGAGWLIKIEPDGDGGMDKLLNAEDYAKAAAEETH